MASRPPLSAGTVFLDRYELVRELGAGGMATVWLATDRRHERPVAVKVLREALTSQLGAERFLREIRIAAQLQHPNILTLIDSGEADGRLFYVMPYVEGETLRERLAREGPLRPGEAVRLLDEVLDALAHAHDRGLVHRDLKPENVMVSGRHALVMDFGVAKAVHEAASPDTLTGTGMALGTPAYMAPEQAAGSREVDQRADIYGVGVMAYELLSGERMFAGVSGPALLAAHIARRPTPLGERCPGLPAGLAEVVMRCLEKAPEQRWPDAEELRAALAPYESDSGASTPAATVAMPARSVRRVPVAALAAAALVLAMGTWWYAGLGPAREMKWARTTGLPLLRQAIEDGKLSDAWRLTRRLQVALPGDSMLAALEPRVAGRRSFRTTPSGAQVWRRDYAGADTTWELWGTTPLESIPVPRARSRIRIEHEGYRTLRLSLPADFSTDSLVLDPLDDADSALVRVAGGRSPVSLVGIDHVPAPDLPPFRLGRYEVTNREYKRFVDAGGYTRREYWAQPFVDGARTLTFEQAMARFVDRTGRPGPATWEAGGYPTGQDEHPVAGVSWYEAMAYAKFAGRALPTLFHWGRAATIYQSSVVVPASNFGGKGTVPVGSTGALNGFGTFDMAGNVREWVANASGTTDGRFILGGGWNDQPYQFTDAYAQPAMDRAPINGIRLARFLPGDTTLATASRAVELAFRDYAREKPVSDEVFAALRGIYAYDHAPPNGRVDSTTQAADWTREEVSFDAAYGGERVSAYLYLPRRGKPPYKAVVFFPGSNAIHERKLGPWVEPSIDYIVRSGRALILPVYKGTFQRGDSLNSDYQAPTSFYRNHVVMWSQDLGRAIDYLATRPDISLDGLAYYGISWGGAMGGLMPAVEPRIKVNVLYVAGLMMQRTLPESDPWNFLPRVTQPTLMLNGRYDFFFPIETAQKPMFANLGAPAAQKRHVVADGGHDVPRDLLVREVLDWLDRYQGKVQ